MASSMLKFFSETLLKSNRNYFPIFVRHTAIKKKPKSKRGTIKHRNLISSTCESLAARGFLRSYKPYTPEEDVKDTVLQLTQKILGNNFDLNSSLSVKDKFYLLESCFLETNHCVPNSLLHTVNTVNDIISFYETPVVTTTPYDELKNQELPPNLHIQYEYERFHPDTDTKFKGISAFPKSSTIVTNIKHKNKYSGFKAESPYIDNEVYIRPYLSSSENSNEEILTPK